MGAVGVSDRVLDYRTTVFDQLLEDDFDVVLDTVGGEKMEERCCSILRNGGHYLGLQVNLLLPLNPLLTPQLSMLGSSVEKNR